MTIVVELLAEHGAVFLVGTTLLLGLGAAAMTITQAPANRQRLGEFCVAATVAWLALAWLPLPRLLSPTNDWFVSNTKQVVSSLSAGDSAGKAVSPTGFVGPHDVANTYTFSKPNVHEYGVESETPSVPRSAPSFRWKKVLAFGYLAGALACLFWLAIGRALLMHSAIVANDPPSWLSDEYAALAAERNAASARLLISRRCQRPVTYGLWKPTILVPSELCDRQRVASLRHVLRHELVHVRRKDIWGNVLLNLASLFLYVHPLFWWLRREIQFSRELIADDQAAQLSTKECYAHELLQVVSEGRGMAAGSIGVLGVFQFPSPFYRRMTMLMSRRESLDARVRRPCWKFMCLLACGVVLLGTTCLIGISPARAQRKSSDHRFEVKRRASESRELVGGIRGATGEAETGGSDRVNVNQAIAGIEVSAHAASPDDGGEIPHEEHIKNCLVGLTDDVDVLAHTEGAVTNMLVREGSTVKAGQVLAHMDERNVRQKVEQAKGKQEDVKIAKIDLRMAEVEAQAAKTNLDRAAKLKLRGAITESEFDNLALAVKRTELHLERAHRELNSVERSAQNGLKTAEAELAACQIRAPIDGVVVQVYMRPGMWVKPGGKVCRVINLSKMRAEAYVDAMRFTPADLAGREVLINVRVPNGEVRQVNAKIVFASPEIEAGPGFKVIAEFLNEKRDGSWTARPGMIAEMIITE